MKVLQFIKSKGCVEDEASVISQVRMWLSDAMNGDYTLILERTKKARSNDQNKLMWVWFTCCAKSFSEAYGYGFTPQNIHDYYCIKFLPVTMPDGMRAPGKTSGLTSDKMTEFLNNVQADAADKGITLLSITDPMYELWSRQYQFNY